MSQINLSDNADTENLASDINTESITTVQEETLEISPDNILKDTESKLSQIKSLATELDSVKDEHSEEIATLIGQTTDIENEIQNIKRNELPIIKVGEITDQLAITIENLGADNPKSILQTANNASTLREILKGIVENGMQDTNIQADRQKFLEVREQRFPHISEYFTTLTNIEIKAFTKMSYENLTDEEKERCIKLIANQNLVYYSGLKDGSHHFNAHLARDTSENPFLNEIMRDGTRELSDAEIAEVDNSDKKVQKVHLNVPPEKRIEVLKAIASCNRAGGPIRNYKMRDMVSEPNGVADFIFYAQDSPEQTAIQIREEIVTKLYEALAPLNLPEITNIPRFSIPALINGKSVSYLTVTQGNGDFKQYLSEHNPQALDTLYDKTQNWAVRNT